MKTDSVEHTHWDSGVQGKLWVKATYVQVPYLFPVHGSALLAPPGVSHKQILYSPHRATTVLASASEHRGVPAHIPLQLPSRKEPVIMSEGQ